MFHDTHIYSCFYNGPFSIWCVLWSGSPGNILEEHVLDFLLGSESNSLRGQWFEDSASPLKPQIISRWLKEVVVSLKVASLASLDYNRNQNMECPTNFPDVPKIPEDSRSVQALSLFRRHKKHRKALALPDADRNTWILFGVCNLQRVTTPSRNQNFFFFFVCLWVYGFGGSGFLNSIGISQKWIYAKSTNISW